MEKNDPLIEFCAIRKSFGSAVANNDISFQIRAGTIHGIIGENGAGKSTAMKILYGQYVADAGEIKINQKSVRWRSSRDAIHAGIGMVHQHFMLAETHTVLENILLETPTPFWRPYQKKAARKKIQALAEQYGLTVDLDARIDTLPVGLQQRVEILKTLFTDSNILILDEPSAVLTPQEIQSLFENLRRLKQEGRTILLITHKLKEIIAVADAVTVFRAGRVVAERAVADTNVKELAELMVGHSISLGEEWPVPCAPKEAALEYTCLKHTFKVHAGEIVGIAGVEGNGQLEIMRAILFPRELEEGSSLRILGKECKHFSAQEIRSFGIGVFAEDRLRDSLLLEENLIANFLLAHRWRSEFQKLGFLRKHEIKRAVQQLGEEYDIRPLDLDLPLRNFSGGNQQKFVVGREFYAAPKILLAAQPTRGVDVGAIESIHQRIFAARDAGAAVLLISSELEEVRRLADRILVIYRGEIVAEFARGAASESEIGLAMGGYRKEAMR